ncbi:signal transduction histidine kinase [Cryobacterium mesophilum]|uniref:Histidine kinase n=1 Tax=Terrimesophilobacter mesophilus TaxID=433647 RepID=A0A4R8VBE0_9MICO|nr:ATP-binding protein [Terrimesophilobacter mesophilus]MBB5633946.1 signal transduction histidine kinase [Terrimesophilobacter mesophilus]TFB80611.1 histidine kinase [Terrimesophilobacter mesophilus]
MELISKERDRLLHRAARLAGFATAIVTFLGITIPGLVDLTSLLAALLLGTLLGFCLFRLGNDHSLLWVLLAIASGLAILTIVQLPFETPDRGGLAIVLVPFAGGTMASFALVLTRSVPRMIVLAATFACSVTLVVLVSGSWTLLTYPVLGVILGWVICTAAGFWISSSVPRAARRIHSIGRAHRAERQASEIEAQRRQSARLLHDTVLATLTLLAHSGVGVTAGALRAQAADDAHLLRQLRLGVNPSPQDATPTSTGSIPLPATDDAILGTTLESVKQRFGRIGLEVSWHGTGQVLLPSDVLDAFLLALAECLENVRRHAGVTEAHVTITDDETTVRAMVTDSGIGFDVKDIDSARLGLKDSVIARLGEVGGTARLFSSPGSGTTVVLEVPK